MDGQRSVVTVARFCGELSISNHLNTDESGQEVYWNKTRMQRHDGATFEIPAAK
jgi:hypothetical protein